MSERAVISSKPPGKLTKTLITGKEEVLACLSEPNTGAEHPHPSFDRKGSVVFFNSPVEKGFCNVCAVELDQVKKP